MKTKKELTPNKIIKLLYKEFLLLHQENVADRFDYTGEAELKTAINRHIRTIGFIEVLSKKSLYLLFEMYSSLQPMAAHSFLIHLRTAGESLGYIKQR